MGGAFRSEIPLRAPAKRSAAERRDLDKINNPMTVAELQTYAPGLDWDQCFMRRASPSASAAS
ncbi:MAG: hypothetical protein ACRD1V_02535 [Vicinamibacterales bacterium]